MRVRVNKQDAVKELKVLKAFQSFKDDKAIRLWTGRVADDDVLFIEAFLFNAHLVTHIPASVIEPGEFCVEKTRFVEVVRSLSGTDFGLVTENGKLLVEDDAFQALFVSCQEVRNRPAGISAPDEAHTVPAQMLNDMLETASFAIPADDVMADKLGLLLQADSQLTRLVATNGHCLALIEEPVGGGGFGIQLPRKLILQVLATLSEVYKDVTLRRQASTLEVSAGTRRLTTQLPKMQFPDYKRILGFSVESEATVETEPALRALRRVCAVTDSPVPGVEVSIGAAVSFGDVNATDVVNASNRIGPDFQIRVNADYLTAALKSSGQAAVLRCGGPSKPLTISPIEGRRTFLIASMGHPAAKKAAA